jgi:hypothetical protein
MKELVMVSLQQQHLKIIKLSIEVIMNFYSSRKMNKLVKCQQIANQKGGILLSTSVASNKKLKWQCREGHVFLLTKYKVKRGYWCKFCGASKGERNVRMILQELNLPFVQQYTLQALPRRKYDFCFQYNNRYYLIEFDGEPHFHYVRKFHKTKAGFLESQVIDRIKTYAAWASGYYLIRIDYTQIEHIKYHIISAINANCIVYLSNPELYKYISDIPITHEQLQRYF